MGKGLGKFLVCYLVILKYMQSAESVFEETHCSSWIAKSTIQTSLWKMGALHTASLPHLYALLVGSCGHLGPVSATGPRENLMNPAQASTRARPHIE